MARVMPCMHWAWPAVGTAWLHCACAVHAVQDACNSPGQLFSSAAPHCSPSLKQARAVASPLAVTEWLSAVRAAQDRDDGAWNLAMAGGTCLTLVASVVGQDVIPLVMPFVQVRRLTGRASAAPACSQQPCDSTLGDEVALRGRRDGVSVRSLNVTSMIHCGRWSQAAETCQTIGNGQGLPRTGALR